MSSVQSFISAHNIGTEPKQINGVWVYVDGRGNLMLNASDPTKGYNSCVIGIPADADGSGISLTVFASGCGYDALPLSSQYSSTTDYKYNPNASIFGYKLFQPQVVDYGLDVTDGAFGVYGISWEYANQTARGQTEDMKRLVDLIISPTGLDIPIEYVTVSGFSDGGLEAVLTAHKLGILGVKTRVILFDSNYFDDLNSTADGKAALDYIAANSDDFDIVFYKPSWNSHNHLEQFLSRKIPFTVVEGEDLSHSLVHHFGPRGEVNLFNPNLVLDDLNDYKNSAGTNPFTKLKAYRVTYDENGNPIWTEVPYDENIYEDFSTSYNFKSSANFAVFEDRVKNLTGLLQFDKKTFGEKLSSDQEKALELMNEIRASISAQESLAQLASGYDMSESTTRVPVEERDYVAIYYEAKLRILEKIANETVSILESAFQIDLTDKKLALEWEKPVEEPEPTVQQTGDGNYHSGGGGGGGIVRTPATKPVKVVFDDNIYSKFPKYDELVKTDNMFVDKVDDCKLVIYHVDDKVYGVEYYYDFGSPEKATEMLSSIQEKYKNYDGYDQVLQNGQYLKVTFDRDYVSKLGFGAAWKKYGGNNSETM